MMTVACSDEKSVNMTFLIFEYGIIILKYLKWEFMW